MKKILHLFFAFYVITISAQGKRFFEDGEVQLIHPVEKINLQYVHNLPFVKATINGKLYNFLFDSGAPTVISTAIYEELKLEKKHKAKVKDSQKNKQEQIFTQLPEMTIDQVVFKNFGVVVMDLTKSELGCFKIDGIIGANQMAKLFWKVNYSENSLEATKNLSAFSLTGYDTVIPFDPKTQKTPVVETTISGKKIDLTFDTGFTGRFRVSDGNYDPKNLNNSVETYGVNAVGAFGTGKPETGYIFKTDELPLGNTRFNNEIIMTGNSNLVGNEFFENFSFIMDWKDNKIYMKRIKNIPAKLESFGFGYRFIEAKPVVSFVFKEENLPVQIDDTIISINDTAFDNLDKESACHYFINRIEKNLKTIHIKLKRNGTVLDLNMDKKEYLK
ncbi:putative aspartyl protease [Chryseobacterium defluvii]|uniref:Putative aspartyl protease n=1 Tax=Chryseobacterium defluvii TaxID=160396 RepID=A0A840K7V8_9FLAO|nr:retropepsin-like aspartic protease [Chryseobacterium defluvii]MBB4805296.1 putative aspartyl protease [Chryseobacterium defluvii]